MIVATQRPVVSGPAFVVAAPVVWKVSFGKRTVGALSFDVASQCWAFEYAEGWIKSGFSLAPIQLPLSSRIYSCSVSELALNVVVAEPSVCSVLRDIFDLPAQLPTSYLLSARPSAIRLERIGPADKNSAVKPLNQELTNSQLLTKAQVLTLVSSTIQGAATPAFVWGDSHDKFSVSALCPGADFRPWRLTATREEGGRDDFRAQHSYYLMAQAAGLACVSVRVLESPDVSESVFLVARHDFSEQRLLYFMPFKYLLARASELVNQSGVITAYRQVLNIAQQWHCSKLQLLLLFRRMVFDVITRNGSKPLETLGFLVSETGNVTLAPAFSFVSVRPPPVKSDALERNDLLSVAAGFKCLHKQADRVIDEVAAVVEQWPTFAEVGGLERGHMQALQRSHRLY